MAGLLVSIDSLLNITDLGAQVGGQAAQLGGIGSTVQALIDGPAELTSLQAIIDAVPLPPGLEGIGNLSTALEDLSIPGDFSDALSHLVTPLGNLSATLSGGAALQATALFDMVREIIRLVTGRVFGGPAGMPDESAIPIPELPDAATFAASIAEARSLLQGFGPRLDAARLLDMLQRGAPGFSEPLMRFPNLPVIDETMEALKTVAVWQSLTPQQLNANLAGTIDLAAELIATPRDRIAKPVLDAAQVIANGASTLSAAQGTLSEVFSTLRPKILSAGAKPSLTEVRGVETTADALEELALSLDPERSPLADVSRLPEDLTRSLLVVARALQPAYDITPVAQRVQAMLAGLPAVPGDAFAEVVAAIRDFDLSALTGALQAVKDTVQSVVDEVNGAKETVRTQLENLLSPVADALDTALEAAGFAQIQSVLENLPGEIQSFVDAQLMPVVEPVRQGIETAVNTVSTAAGSFSPQALIAPIANAVNDLAALLNSDAVRSAFAEVEHVISTVIEVLENFNLTAAADQSVSSMGEIEAKLSSIDPAMIPDAAKPTIRQAVQVVTDIDFSGEVAVPIADAIELALREGPQAVLGALEGGMDALRSRLEQFRPSSVIGDALDQPFRELTDTLRQFKPSDLLTRLQETLNGLASRVNILDVGAVVDPLVQLHQGVVSQVAALRPSVLLAPVNQAIEAAIERVYEVTGFDTAFDGLNDVFAYIQSWTGLLADSRDLLRQAATLFQDPGDATAAVNQLVDDAVAKLDSVDLGLLQAAFGAAGEAVRRIERDAVAGELARALQNAGRQGPAALGSPTAQQNIELIRAFPLDTLRAHRPIPLRSRLVQAMERLAAAADTLERARQPWTEIGARLQQAAGELQEELLDYYKIQQLNAGGVFAQFKNPPQNVAALKESVRAALADGLNAPLTTVVAAFQAFAPYIELLAQGLSDILDATHGKLDSIVGEAGVGGAVQAVEEAANLLRGIDLGPVSAPLDAVYARIETAVDALDPEPLRAVLQAAQDAISDLLSLATLVSQSQIDTLDAAYQAAVTAIGDLAPSDVISQTLDPVYEDLLADFLPVLDLPVRLRELTETAGRRIGEDAVRELARVEVAFDDMLRAIPLDAGVSGVQASATVSIG